MAKILIVDDSKTSRKVLRNMLEADEHIIVGEALNGEEALLMYEEFQPEAVTMDITMPKMDGIEALECLMHTHPDAKVIMVTAAGQKNNVITALKLGAKDFIQKPFEQEDLSHIVSKVLAGEEME